MKISARGITRAFIKEFAIDYFPGIVAKWVNGKTVKEFYSFIESGSFWEKIPPGQQNWLLSYKPWKLDWLTLEWLIGAIGKANPRLGYLIGSSGELQAKLQEGINNMKKRLEQ